MSEITRRGLLGGCIAALVAIVARPVTAARAWVYAVGRTTGVTEYGLFKDFDVDPAVFHMGYVEPKHNFEVDQSIYPSTWMDREKMHDVLDKMIDVAHHEMAKRPDHRVWRVGQLRMRVRSGPFQTYDNDSGNYVDDLEWGQKTGAV